MSSFFFSVGDRDVSPFVRVGSGEGWDPAAGDYLDPQFSQSPLREGGELIQDTLGLRQMQVPLALNPRPYAATNAIQRPSFEGAATDGNWQDNAWNGGTNDVVGSPALDSQALRYSGTVANLAAFTGVAQGGTYMAVTPGASDQVFYQMSIFSPSPPDFFKLDVRSWSSGAASAIANTNFASTAASVFQRDAQGGGFTVVQGVISPHASAAFVQPRFVTVHNVAVATYDQLDMVVDQAMFVKLPGGTVPNGPLEYFDGDSLDGYWAGERSNSYSMTRVGKDGLHQMIQDLNRELARDDAQVKWRDAGADALTFLDLARGRFDPEFNFRLAENNWAKGKLDLWCQPLGHTATERIVATAGATAAAFAVPIPPSLSGDAPALAINRITVGSYVPLAGNIVAVAPLPHPSYAAFIPAASLANIPAGATLLGASGAQGSQVVAMVPSFGLTTTGGTYPRAFQFSLAPASVYAGRHRVLGLAKSNLYSGNALRLFDPSDQPAGPTALAAFSPDGFAPVDLGVLTVPSEIDAATYTCYVQGGAPNTASEAALRPGMLASYLYGLHINGIVLLPEEDTQLVVDAARENMVWDSFSVAGSRALAGELPAVGGAAWATMPGSGNPVPQQREDAGGEIVVPSAAAEVDAVLAGLFVGDMRVRSAFYMATAVSNVATFTAPAYSISHGLANNQKLTWGVQGGNNSVRSLNIALTTVGTYVASVGLASFAGPEFLIEAGVQGPQAWVSLRPFGQPKAEILASVAASNAAFQQRGEPGVMLMAPSGVAANGTAAVAVRDFVVDSIPSVGRPARSVYLLDGPAKRTHRQDASQTYLGDIGGMARGQNPEFAVPTTPAVAVLETALEGEPANDVTNVEIRIREHFRFAR